jgi:hypothetical protein
MRAHQGSGDDDPGDSITFAWDFDITVGNIAPTVTVTTPVDGDFFGSGAGVNP